MLVCQRQCKNKGAALVYGALNPNPAVMGFNQLLGDIKPQTGAHDTPGQGTIRPVKALEDMGLCLFRDSDTLVCHLYLDFIYADIGPHGYLGAGRAEFNRITQ